MIRLPLRILGLPIWPCNTSANLLAACKKLLESLLLGKREEKGVLSEMLEKTIFLGMLIPLAHILKERGFSP